MRRAVYYRLVAIAVIAVVVCSLISSMIFAVYSQNQAEYWLIKLTYSVESAYENNPDAASLSAIIGGSRVTVIAPDGAVLSDSEADAAQMENHFSREEIQNASEDKVYIAIHNSATLGQQYMYATIAANDGNVIRVAYVYSGLISNIAVQLSAVLLAIGVALVVSIFFAGRFSGNVFKPLERVVQSLTIGKYDELPQIKSNYYEVDRLVESVQDLSARLLDQKQLEQQKQDFFSNASHELKTPITSISGFAEMLSLGLLQTDEEKLDVINRIESESKRMTELINHILIISKLESPEASSEATSFDFENTVMDAVRSVSLLQDQMGVEFELDLASITVSADKTKLYELAVNLIENAVKYNKPGGRVNVRLQLEGQNAILTVADTGIGIPLEFQPRVFERFFRVDYGRDKKIGGTGLGLSIVKHIVAFYEGEISLQSQQDQGTTITVSLPIVV